MQGWGGIVVGDRAGLAAELAGVTVALEHGGAAWRPSWVSVDGHDGRVLCAAWCSSACRRHRVWLMGMMVVQVGWAQIRFMRVHIWLNGLRLVRL